MDRVSATVNYFICCTPRCGSTLLSQALAESGIAGAPDEYFVHLRGEGESYRGWPIDDYRQYIKRVQGATVTPNGVFGAKMMGGHVWDFVERVRSIDGLAKSDISLAEALDVLFPNLHYVWLTRRNKVRQAVSWWKAAQTDQWTSQELLEVQRVPEYNFDAIDQQVQQIVMREAALQAYFDEVGAFPLTIVYEDYRHQLGSTVQRVLGFLGQDRTLSVETPPLRQQADALNEEWVLRYRREKQAQEGWWRRVW